MRNFSPKLKRKLDEHVPGSSKSTVNENDDSGSAEEVRLTYWMFYYFVILKVELSIRFDQKSRHFCFYIH